MRILHIISQKPGETGSGMYIRNIIKEFKSVGYTQGLICGIENIEDINGIDEICSMYEVYFNSEELPYDIVGMSDVMPYKSTTYREMDEDMVKFYEKTFKTKVLEGVQKFKPDIILSHHLYLLTSLVVSWVEDIKVIGFCHGTDLRQLKSHNLREDFIKDNINKLGKIIALHEEQKQDIVNTYGVSQEKIVSLGIGYNPEIFYNMNMKKSYEIIDIVYTGKISKAKGVNYLVKAFSGMKVEGKKLRLNIIGMGTGDEYLEILRCSKKSKNEISFLGKLTQKELCRIYNRCHIFILPSLYEGLPLVLVEALACGLKVITSDLPGIRTWFGDEINSARYIEYINVPPKESIDSIISEYEGIYIENIRESLVKSISILEGDSIDNLDFSRFTWTGIACNVNQVILNLFKMQNSKNFSRFTSS